MLGIAVSCELLRNLSRTDTDANEARGHTGAKGRASGALRRLQQRRPMLSLVQTAAAPV